MIYSYIYTREMRTRQGLTAEVNGSFNGTRRETIGPKSNKGHANFFTY